MNETIGDESVAEFRVAPTSDLLRAQHEAQTAPSTTASTPLALLLASPRYDGPLDHWSRAQSAAHGPKRDLLAAAREGISAVEGLARVITGRHQETLGELIKVLKTEYGLNPALAKSVEGVWGFTNTWPGIRHGAAIVAPLSPDDARFVLDSCDAATRLLLALDRGASPKLV